MKPQLFIVLLADLDLRCMSPVRERAYVSNAFWNERDRKSLISLHN